MKSIRRKSISDVFLDRWSLKLLLASAVEVYPYESMGLLWGIKSYRTLTRKKNRVISIKSVYPIQTVHRGYTQVDWGNQAAKERLLNTLKTLKAGMVGEFHSHTKGGALATLSDADINYYLRESQEGREILGNDWIELIVRINKHETNCVIEEPIYGNYNYKKAEKFHINSGDNTYDITLSAYFIKEKQNEPITIQGSVWINWPIT